MAIAVGVVVANLYYAQPLEDTLTRSLHTSIGAIGLVIALLQIGYAIGMAMLVPLGDLLERRRLIMVLLTFAVAGLVTMAVAPTVAVLGAAAVVVGLACAAIQIIVPFAAHLTTVERQGRVISTVMGGLLFGILVARTLAGLLGEVAGWRAVFGVGAVITGAVGVMLWRELPTVAPVVRMRYPRLLASVVTIVREEPALRLRMVYGAMVFASFSAFWSSAGFLLARQPYGWSDAAIGLFALVGAAGVLAARSVGKLADRGLAGVVTGSMLAVMTMSYLFMAWGGSNLAALIVGVVLMDLGCQAVQISNQSNLYRLRPDARSRINTAYMTAYFLGGSLGSLLSASFVYPQFGWTGVCVIGAGFPAVALIAWAVEALRHRPGRRRQPGPANRPTPLR
jgi:predicted MFS family arabinose efflux permease